MGYAHIAAIRLVYRAGETGANGAAVSLTTSRANMLSGSMGAGPSSFGRFRFYEDTPMKRFAVSLALGLGLLAWRLPVCRAGEDGPDTRTADVVYGKKEGVALTMDVFTPKKNANGAAVIWVVSGGWFSSHAGINPKNAEP